MKISKVKLLQEGVKGLEVHYVETSEKDGITFCDEHVAKFTSPAHKELKLAFQKLKFHLLTFYRLAKDKYALENTKVTSITSNGTDFLITGKMKSHGDTTVVVNTPLVNEAVDYADHDGAIEIVDEIYMEVEKYVEGTISIDKKQLIIDFYTQKKDKEKVSDVENLTEDQIVEEARNILEARGAIVMMESDMEKTERGDATMVVNE